MTEDVDAIAAGWRLFWLQMHPRANPHQVAAFASPNRGIEIVLTDSRGAMKTVLKVPYPGP